MPLPARDLRVVICEDEYMLALDMAQQLEQHGAVVSGSYVRASELIAGLSDGAMGANAAILDLDLEDAALLAAVDLLQQRGMAVVFCSGYMPSDLPERVAHIPFFSKPASFEDILTTLCETAVRRSDHHSD